MRINKMIEHLSYGEVVKDGSRYSQTYVILWKLMKKKVVMGKRSINNIGNKCRRHFT